MAWKHIIQIISFFELSVRFCFCFLGNVKNICFCSYFLVWCAQGQNDAPKLQQNWSILKDLKTHFLNCQRSFCQNIPQRWLRQHFSLQTAFHFRFSIFGKEMIFEVVLFFFQLIPLLVLLLTLLVHKLFAFQKLTGTLF